MSLFGRNFQHLLEQDAAPAEITDQQAMAQELDKGSAPSDFDAQAPANSIEQARSSQVAAQKKTLGEWIQRVADFVNFLNGTNSDSMQSVLHTGTCDSLFEKIANSEKKRISRVAMELSSLNESLKGYLIAGEEK